MARRVCLLSAEYPPARGGVGDYTRELAAGLRRAGLACSVLTSRRDASPHEDPAGVPVRATIADWGTGSWAAVVAALQADRPGVLHVQYQTGAYAMHPAINLLPWRLRLAGVRTPVITTFHDLRPPYLFPKAGAARHLAALALAAGSARLVLVTREHWGDTPLAWLRRLQPGLARRTWLIPIGSNIPVEPPAGYGRAAWRASLGVATDEVLLAYFGFINRSKGVDDLFYALARLRQAGERVRLLMIGGGGGPSNAADAAWRGEIEAMGPRLGLAEALIWTGFGDARAVSGHLLAADLCVLPFRDGATFQRGTLMAALAHGLPVVSTLPPRVDIISQPGALPRGWGDETTALAHGRNVWLVPPADPTALATAIQALAQDTDAKRGLSEGARRVAQAVGWDAIATRHAQLYEEL